MSGLTHQQILSHIPTHLQQYVVEQHYDRYTPQDHAVWRYIMRKNLNFLGKHAHPAYLDGLRKTGISADHIPDIIEMNEALQKLGWSAVVVNGFIPPAAFMEFQANRILVISAEMRTIGHILYTPAPDIVHEAAGHTPIIADEAYAVYLQKFGEYGTKAMSSKIDFEIYEAIRNLSIIKEYPYATDDQISEAESDLEQKLAANTIPSEATKLSRLHWWTVEYGLIGTPDNFKQYGAGLLSSVGESQGCLSTRVKKIPLTTGCVNYNYDITQMQPQLFVTRDWDELTSVLEEFADTMCFRIGGVESIREAIKSENIATAEYSSGLQVSGRITEVLTDHHGREAYIKTSGKSALAYQNVQINGHGIEYHTDGFGSPVGRLNGVLKPIETFSSEDISEHGIKEENEVYLDFTSGISVKGNLKSIMRRNGSILMFTFADCLVKDNRNNVLFQPDWGLYDMAVGEKIVSVYSGTADKEKFNVFPEKSEKVAIEVEYTDRDKALFMVYQDLREIRRTQPSHKNQLGEIYDELNKKYPEDWLIRLELYEMVRKGKNHQSLQKELEHDLQQLRKKSPEYDGLISSGLELIENVLSQTSESGK